MRRLMAPILALATALTMTLPAAAVSPSEAAHLCAGNGFANLQRADGTGFRNAGECISYAARTGTLQEALTASSTLTIIGGGAACEGPDGNGDLSCSEGAGGCISGTFSTPTCPTDNTSSFSYMNQYVWHADGSATGSGTATCSGCNVAGRSGDIDFVTTGQGQGTPSIDFPLILSSGSWRISSAAGGLTGLSGSGTWALDPATLDHIYSGTLTLPF